MLEITSMRNSRLNSNSGLRCRHQLLSPFALGTSSLLVFATLAHQCAATPIPSPVPTTEKSVAKKPVANKVQPPQSTNSDYVLGVDDVLEIRVSNHPDLNTTTTVSPDGRITLDRAGELMATGKTASALAKEIEAKLARTLNNARVQVAVKQARLRQSRILGAVKNPGAYPLKRNARLGELVAQAGGLNTKPSRITARLIRGGNIIPLQIRLALEQPSSNANIVIQPDDLVELTAPDFTRQLTVTGSVAHPGTFDLDEDLTVIGLLTQAGEPTTDAALKKAYVLRNGKHIPLDLSGSDAGRSTLTFKFQVGDTLVVPTNENRFGILGEVARSGYYMVPEKMEEATVLKAIAQAGGPTPDGDLSNVTLTRINNGTSVQLTVDALSMLKGTKPDDVVLKDNDLLTVPKKRDYQIQVTGAVTRPGSYSIGESMTLSDVLAQIGNPTNEVGLGRAYVLRNGAQIPVDLRGFFQGKLDEKVTGFRLQPGDVLAVPDVHEQILVNGDVGKPGLYDLTDDLTIATIIAKVGGFTPEASLGQAYVLRGTDKIPLDLHLIAAGQADPKVMGFKFQPRDTFVVPKNPLHYAVLGQVGRPGVYPYPEGKAQVTVLQALISAGFGGGASGKAGILRQSAGQAVTIIPIDVEAIFEKGSAKDNVVLQPRDVLYIPPRNAKRGILGTLASVAQSVSFIGLFGGL